ncbi:MAG: undecaprenyl-diphosphate phosphatase [Spirochaetes bacterium]|nr:undecaprenyl-diphosphate phosphatase [Spirochaetota bacterium]
MTILQAILLGAFQGAAEFLPVSSSGHLLIFKRLFGLSGVPMLFDVTLHLATLLSVVVVFRARIGGVLAAIARWVLRRNSPKDAENLAIVPPAIAATFATAIIGFGISRFMPGFGPKAVSACFIATAAILVATLFMKGEKGYEAIGLREGLLVGIAQGIGVLPGISRSGITIAGGLAAGMNRGNAGEFAFLLAIPAVLGALVLDLKDAGTLAGSVGPLELSVAAAVAFAVGVIVLSALLPLLRMGKLAWFAAYLVPAGILGLLFL